MAESSLNEFDNASLFAASDDAAAATYISGCINALLAVTVLDWGNTPHIGASSTVIIG